jgi:acetyl-CoA acetyltransferase
LSGGLVYFYKRQARLGAHWGVVSMCIGGGQGFAAVFER